MASLIKSDHLGLIGPIFTLIKCFKSLKNEELAELLHILEVNYSKFCDDILPEKKEVLNAFKQNTDVENILQMKFFQKMQRLVTSEQIMNMIKNDIISVTIKHHDLTQADLDSSQLINDYIINLYSYMLTDEQIEQISKSQQDTNADEINKFRSETGMLLYRYIDMKLITEADFDNMLMAIDIGFRACNPNVLQFVGKYLTLFSMSENPAEFKQQVTSLLDGVLRVKAFKKDKKDES